MAGCHSFPMHTSLALSCSSFISTHGRGNSNNLVPRGILSSLRPNVEVVDLQNKVKSETPHLSDLLKATFLISCRTLFSNPFYVRSWLIT